MRGTERALMIARELGHPFVGPTGNKRRTFWEKLYGENLVPGMDKPSGNKPSQKIETRR